MTSELNGAMSDQILLKVTLQSLVHSGSRAKHIMLLAKRLIYRFMKCLAFMV